MYNRYQGNTGKVRRVEEGRGASPPAPDRGRNPAGGEPTRRPPPPPAPKQGPNLMEQLGRLLPGTQEELDTEDLILLLILYLMYRESGDSELLMIMGAMFLL